MKKWFVGCSGFSYMHWKNSFYAGVPQRRWFEHYCEHFNTVELNVTFYRVPKPEVFRGWYNRSPNDFRFTVKAPRLITHYKRFKNITAEIVDFCDLVQCELQEKLGTILFQLHPKFAYSDENLDLLLLNLVPGFKNVIEFRHESWWNARVYKLLSEHEISFCGISYPTLPDDALKTSSIVYYRFHGVPKLYFSSYSDEMLFSVASQLKAKRGVDEIYIYFNNDINVHAIWNAKSFQEMTGGKVVTAPVR